MEALLPSRACAGSLPVSGEGSDSKRCIRVTPPEQQPRQWFQSKVETIGGFSRISKTLGAMADRSRSLTNPPDCFDYISAQFPTLTA
jgi:hypothetical protein